MVTSLPEKVDRTNLTTRRIRPCDRVLLVFMGYVITE